MAAVPHRKGSAVSDKKTDFLTLLMHLNVTPAEHERFLAAAFYHRVGYFPNLRDPKTFNEKVAWMRLNWTSAEVDRIVEKADFKDWVEERIGPGYTPQTYGVYTDPWKIDFDALPDSFMMKSTLGSSANQVMRVTGSDLDVDFARYTASEWLQRWNSGAASFSNWFRGRSSRVIVEELLVDPKGADAPPDYKFLCFNGKPEVVLCVSDRFNIKYADFFDMDWNHISLNQWRPNSPTKILAPPNLQTMLDIAESLAHNFPYVRVDAYDLHDRVLIGELTFSPGIGMWPFEPQSWDSLFGEMFQLPMVQ